MKLKLLYETVLKWTNVFQSFDSELNIPFHRALRNHLWVLRRFSFSVQSSFISPRNNPNLDILVGHHVNALRCCLQDPCLADFAPIQAELLFRIILPTWYGSGYPLDVDFLHAYVLSQFAELEGTQSNVRGCKVGEENVLLLSTGNMHSCIWATHQNNVYSDVIRTKRPLSGIYIYKLFPKLLCVTLFWVLISCTKSR